MNFDERLNATRLVAEGAFEDQRIDLRQRAVGVHVAPVQLLEHVDRLGLGCRRHANAVGELGALRVGQPRRGVDEDLQDLLGRRVRDFLDVHAAFAAGHDCDLLRGAVGDGRDVVLLLDVGPFLDQQAAHLLAFGAGLVGLELHAEDLAGELLDLVERARELDATALAAAAGMDLRLHHPDRATELLRRLGGFQHAERGVAARHRHTELAQDFLALVLVDLHGRVSRTFSFRK